MRSPIAILCLLVALSGAAAAQLGLPTTLAAGNGADGNMFDVVAARDLLITGFDVNVRNDIDTIEVYAVTGGGTFVGNETNPGAWTLIDTVPVIGEGEGQATQVPLSDGIFVGAGQTLGLYVTANGPSSGGFRYTNGADFLGPAAQDASLTVLEGVGKQYPFGGTAGGTGGPGGASRIFNGRVQYEIVATPSTGFGGGIGQDGNMFDVVASVPITLHEIETHLSGGTWDVEVWVTDFGTFVGKENDASQWTLLGSTTVTSAGSGNPTAIPLNFDLDFSGTRGFYVTTTGGLGALYSAGSNFGGAAVDDGTVQTLEGVAKSYPFGATIGGTTPGGVSRIWNGTFIYSRRPQGGFLESFDGLPGGGSDAVPVGWMQDLNDVTSGLTGANWLFRSNGPSSGNGPTSDHTNPGVGNFAYTEDSGSSNHPAINLLTPLFVKSPGNDALSFWVNSNDAGANQNPLAVDVIEYPSGRVNRDIVLPIGETAGVWTQFTACLTPYEGPYLQIRFRGRTDSGTFVNDVGLDDVFVGANLPAPPVAGQPPQSGLATLDINEAGDPEFCSPVTDGQPGPYRANAHGGGLMEITITSEPTVPVLFFAGPTNANLLDLGAIGKLDVGLPGLTGIVLIADGNGTSFLDSLFRTNAAGSIEIGLPTPAGLLGFNLGFQVITFNSSPSAISLSNAVDVTFIP